MILKLSNRRQGWYYYEVEKVATQLVTKEEYCGQDGYPLPAYDLSIVNSPPEPRPGELAPCFRLLEISYHKKGSDEVGTIITSHAAYLMNDEGRTIEVLNPDPGDQILPELTEEEKAGPWTAEVTDLPERVDCTPKVLKPKPNPGIDTLVG